MDLYYHKSTKLIILPAFAAGLWNLEMASSTDLVGFLLILIGMSEILVKSSTTSFWD